MRPSTLALLITFKLYKKCIKKPCHTNKTAEIRLKFPLPFYPNLFCPHPSSFPCSGFRPSRLFRMCAQSLRTHSSYQKGDTVLWSKNINSMIPCLSFFNISFLSKVLAICHGHVQGRVSCFHLLCCFFSIMWIQRRLLSHFPLHGHLGCFYFCAVVNNAAISILAHSVYFCMCMIIFSRDRFL